MLEILLIIGVTKHLASVAKKKGRSSAWAAFGAVFWIVGELVGFMVGALAGMEGFAAYGPALLFAAVGAGMAFAIVYLLPEVARHEFNGLSAHPSVTQGRYGQ